MILSLRSINASFCSEVERTGLHGEFIKKIEKGGEVSESFHW